MEVRFPEEPRFAPWKLPLLQYLIVGLLLSLLAGYWRLQITGYRKYLTESQRNRIRELPIIAPRGRILDRNGRVLASNTPAFSVLLSRGDRRKLALPEIKAIARGLSLDPDALQEQLAQAARLPGFQPIVIKKDAAMDDVAFTESHRTEFPQLDLIQIQSRFYPLHDIASAALGHVGDVSEAMVAEKGSRFRPGDIVGRSGIELEYDSLLSGTDGMQRVLVNSRGQEIGAMSEIPPVPGHDLRLTLDLKLQLAADAALGERPGAVVALDPRNGQVLAMVSHPAFDPNDFAGHITSAEWKQLMTDPNKPLMNKAIQAQLAPGSVFKIVTAIAALESHAVTPSFTVFCPGYIKIYGHTYHDWTWWVHRPGHGVVSLHRAIMVSCDVYFYTLGKMLGIGRLDFYAHHLGLGEKTGIDLPGEEPGLVPSPAWVERDFHHKWYAGETISVAIGQGALEVTPIQLARMIGGVVSGGELYRPHLIFRNELLALGADPPSDVPADFPLQPTTVQAVGQGMWGVVNGGGTGAGARVPGVTICGKTGTAQVVSDTFRRAGHHGNFTPNSWFVGYAPASQPAIVVAVLVMHGTEESGAPVAGQVIKTYFEEKGWLHAPASPANPVVTSQTALTVP
jgi:penicillin-binding protein 2